MRQNRQNERERGGMEGGGSGVCDCQLWERDPPGGVKVQEKRKKEQKSEKRASQQRDEKKEEKKRERMLF